MKERYQANFDVDSNAVETTLLHPHLEALEQILHNEKKAEEYIHAVVSSWCLDGTCQSENVSNASRLALLARFVADQSPDEVNENLQDNPGLDRYIILQRYPTLFTRSLVEMVRFGRGDETYASQTNTFISFIHDVFFEYDTNMFFAVPVEEMMTIASHVNAFEELRGVIGPQCVEALSLKLQSGDSSLVTRVNTHVEHIDGGVRVDILNQLETIFAHAVGNGYAQTETNVRAIIDHFQGSDIPLTKLVARLAYKRLEDPLTRQKLGAVKVGKDREGRLDAAISNTIPDITDRCVAEIPEGAQALPLRYRLKCVARDAVIATDRAGLPRYGATGVDTETIIKTSPDLVALPNVFSKLLNVQYREVNFEGLVQKIEQLRGRYGTEESSEIFYADVLGVRLEDIEQAQATSDTWRIFLKNIFFRNWESIRHRLCVRATPALFNDTSVPHVFLSAFDAVTGDGEINPFASLTYGDDLLIAQMMRSDVRTELETELGVSLQTLSFRSQVHLFRFLSVVQEGVYQRLQKVLAMHPAHTREILETFVGCAEDVEFGNELLELCEASTDTELASVLSTYQKVLNAADDLHTMLVASTQTHERVVVDDWDGRRNEMHLQGGVQEAYVRNLYMRARNLLMIWKQAMDAARVSGTTLDQQSAFLEQFERQATQVSILLLCVRHCVMKTFQYLMYSKKL